MNKRNRNVNRTRASSTNEGGITNCLIAAPRIPRASAETEIVATNQRYATCVPGMDFRLLKLNRHAVQLETTSEETLWVLLSGRISVAAGGRMYEAERTSLFDQGPTSLHCGAGERVVLRAETGAEFAVVRAGSSRFRGVQWSTPAECASENRGAGLVQGACQRIVRTIFDYSSRRSSNLVAGEVVNFPGRWSSYPPHHHAQPEIYHYRFTQPRGYGHAELGDAVLKVRDRDTVVIPGGLDHAQVSAPGYGMYYLWIVRHLPRRPYKGFTFTREHTWLLDPKNQGWLPTTPTP